MVVQVHAVSLESRIFGVPGVAGQVGELQVEAIVAI